MLVFSGDGSLYCSMNHRYHNFRWSKIMPKYFFPGLTITIRTINKIAITLFSHFTITFACNACVSDAGINHETLTIVDAVDNKKSPNDHFEGLAVKRL